MIKNAKIAAKIASELLGCSAKLDASIVIVQDECDAEDFNLYQAAMARVMAELYFEVLRPLYEEHPQIKPAELD